LTTSTNPACAAVTVVTGFLGAGKTTLMRHAAAEQLARLAVIVNDFGKVGD